MGPTPVVIYSHAVRVIALVLLQTVLIPTLFAQGQGQIALQQLVGSVQLDGLSNEPAWDNIRPLPVTMYLPVFGGLQTEKTEIPVAYDDEYFYAAGRFYDSDPSGIRINSLYRDRWSGDDAFALYLDTLEISPTQVNTNVLIPGVHRYLVYFKMGKDSTRTRHQFWSRKIDKITYRGKEAISVTQEWEDNDSVFHNTYSVCDAKTFAPLYHKSWWKGRGSGSYDFLTREAIVDGKPLREKTDSVSMARYDAFNTALSQYVLNWHLDLEVFPILPYKGGRTFVINFYDPGLIPPRKEMYTVVGSETLDGYNSQKIDCWLLRHGSLPQNLETFWVSKKTGEVLKLEQEFGGRFRYKVKLGFSN